jgi:16S rRNA (guanine966-N2)-methyltransferase
VESGFYVLKQDVIRTLQKLEADGITADFVFIDPPYRMEQRYQQTLEFLGDSRLLRSNGIVIAEHQRKFDPEEIFGLLRRYRKLKQGDAVLSFYRNV